MSYPPEDPGTPSVPPRPNNHPGYTAGNESAQQNDATRHTHETQELPTASSGAEFRTSYPSATHEQSNGTWYSAQPGPSMQTQYGTAPHASKPTKKRRFGSGALVTGMVLAALIGGGAAAGGSALLAQQNGSTVVSAQANKNAPVVVNDTSNVNEITAAAAKATPSVVTISVTGSKVAGEGSGIILDTDGHILTNNHVVTLDGQAQNAKIQVQLSTGAVYSASVVGTDPSNDLAVLKIDAPDLTPATLGDSSKLNVGQVAIAIGSPLGLSGTVTNGIISTVNRTISIQSSAAPQDDSSSSDNPRNPFNFAPPDGSKSQQQQASSNSLSINVIQTDAAINHGNSGGALVNAQGQVIGVNVAIASAGGSSSDSSDQSGSIGVGFAIPIDTAARIAKEIINTGTASHGQLGVSVQSQAAADDGQNGASFTTGAVVADVTNGSAAAKAGLQKGDIITKLGSRDISSASSLTAAVREQPGGATVPLTYQRGSTSQTVNVTLGTAS